MAIAGYILARVFKAILVLIAIAVLNFVLIHAAPGDPAAVMAGEAGAADEIFLQQLKEKFGLDQPYHVQLWNYLAGVLQLDLGFSYRQEMPVAQLIMDRLPATLLLTGTAFVVSILLGVMLGALAAVRVGRWADSAITTLALLFYATPLFWIALMAILLFSVQLEWLPAYGIETIGANYTGWAQAMDVAQHLVLPAATLGLFFMAVYARMTRASMLETAGQDFVKTAKAKGLGEGPILRRHILRNAILPVVTLAGLQAGQIVGGAILTETVFAWPGIGRLMFDALLQRDYNLLLGVFLVSSALVLFFNLVTDLLYLVVDPRITLTQ
ncbi:MAG: ABC transporter permease [Kiloniellales bacterium]